VPIQHLYRRQYQAAAGDWRMIHYACITSWDLAGIPPGAICAASGHHLVEMHNQYVIVQEH
jgi:hypothetical protein